MMPYFPLVIHSLALTLEILALSVPLGTAVAWMLLKSDLPGRRAAVSIIVVLLFLPLYLQAAPGRPVLGRKDGMRPQEAVNRG